MKKIATFFIAVIFLMNLYGCFALFAGAAAGAGTAGWLSGKLSQAVQAPYERAINATKSALKSLKLEVTKETRTENVTQIRSKYTDAREVWIDIRRVSDTSSKVEVRVGVAGDKEASDVILKRIIRYL